MNRSHMVVRRGATIAAFLAFLSVAPAPSCGESSLSVTYQAHRLSIEAREVSLETVLRAIGAQVGFSVVENGRSSAVITLSLRNASVEEALEQLLRLENSTVMYRAGTGEASGSTTIDRIVLLGEPDASAPTVASSGPIEGQPSSGSGGGDQTFQTAAAPVASPTAPESFPGIIPWDRVSSWDGTVLPEIASDPGSPPVTVGDLLRIQAMVAAPPGVSSGASSDDGAAMTAPPTPPIGSSSSLAEATVRAQQALAALVNGLAAATRSMNQALSARGK